MTRKWVKAFTYAPKIPEVRSGRCRQTIRPGHTVKGGDMITFHGWAGRPYWSAWSWRLEHCLVKDVKYVYMFKNGILFLYSDGWTWFNPWGKYNVTLDLLAFRDGIDPPTGYALGKLMNKHHKLIEYTGGKKKEGKPMQIITWVRQNHQSDYWRPEGSYKRFIKPEWTSDVNDHLLDALHYALTTPT